MKNNSRKWFSGYLLNRKQFIQAGAIKISSLHIICGVPQGSILWPLLFTIYVNHLCSVSKIFEPIIFADDTNLFFSHKSIKGLFHTANLELNKVFRWFNANKLFLNKDKTKYTFFHKASEKDNIPLRLASLFINDREIKRIISIKYLVVLIDKHFTWKEHITVIENKISKALGLLYKPRKVLDSTALKNPLYIVVFIAVVFLYTHLHYGNIIWASTTTIKLKKTSQ